jgi:hypothetical protein
LPARAPCHPGLAKIPAGVLRVHRQRVELAKAVVLVDAEGVYALSIVGWQACAA